MTPLLIALKRDLKRLTARVQPGAIPEAPAANLATDSNEDPAALVQVLDKPVDSLDTLSADAIAIELRPSKRHAVVLGALASLSLITCLSSQLPWFFCIGAGLWVFASLLHWRLNPQRIRYLIDDGETWHLTTPQNTRSVNYQQADYCTANLLVMRFKSSSGKPIRVFVWRDAVTPAAFSWLAARMTLSDADAPVQNVATSGVNAVFSFS